MADRIARPKFAQPLDRAAILLMLALSLVIGLVLLKGDRTAPHIRNFSWQDKQVGAENTAFVVTFSRPMDQASVETNLRLEPPLKGKFSWAGRRMAYTLDEPAPYGREFQFRLQGARDRFSRAGDTRTQMQPFGAQFRTRDSAFVYLGVKGETAGRLVLYNLTQDQQQILTPEDLVVMDFKPYPYGDRIVFSANDRTSQGQNLLNQQLYTVTTGIQLQAPAQDPGAPATATIAPVTQPPGIVERILDSQDYQNLKFDLSPDGQKIIVQRVNRANPADFGLWVIESDQPPQPLETQPGGDFLIAPDSKALAINQGQGVAILPLATGAEPLDFLSQFGQTLSFKRDGSGAAMVRFNAVPNEPTRSLFYVTNQGGQRELFTTDGSILSAQFHPTRPLLYCLYTRLIPSDEYLEQPYLAAIDLKTAERTDLLMLPIQRDIQVSLSPDGRGILFDQIVADGAEQETGVVRGNEGQAIADSSLWFLPLAIDEAGKPTPIEAQALPLPGLRPRWLP